MHKLHAIAGYFRNHANGEPMVNLVSQLLKAFGQFLMTIFLARSLSPESFGYFAFAVAVLVVFETVRDFGYTSLALKRNSDYREDFENDFKVMTSRGILLGFSMCAITLSISQFSKFNTSPLLICNLAILSAVPIIAGLSGAYNIKLWKARSLKQLVNLDLIAFLSSMLVLPVTIRFQILEITMALQILVYQMVLLLLRLIYVRRDTNVNVRLDQFKLMYRDSPNLGFFSLLRLFTANLDTFIVGVVLGPTSLGLYNRAFQVSQVPIQLGLEPQTNYVIRRSIGSAGLENAFNIFRIVSIPIFSFLIFVFLNSKDFLESIFGSSWVSASSILSVLCFVGMLRCFEYKIYWALLISDQHELLMRQNLHQVLLITLGILCGSAFGTIGVAAGIGFALVANIVATLLKIRNRVIGTITSFCSLDLIGFAIVLILQIIPYLVDHLMGVSLSLGSKFAFMLVATMITSVGLSTFSKSRR